MNTKEGKEKDTRDLILESVGKLKEKIESLEKESGSKKEQEDLCWWDARPCVRHAGIAGLQEAGALCFSCHQIDTTALCNTLEQMQFIESEEDILRKLKNKETDVRREEGERLEDTLQEIHEKIVDILVDMDIEPPDLFKKD